MPTATARPPAPPETARADRTIRIALWATVALNALGVVLLAPLAWGRDVPMLPVAPSPYLAAQLVFTIALFGCVYAWLALQPRIPRSLVVVGAIGKLGFFALTAAYAGAGLLPATTAVNATPDLVLALVFLWWAFRRRYGPANHAA